MTVVGRIPAYSSAFRCSGCRASIWAAFASSLRPIPQPEPVRRSGHVQRRELRTSSRLRQGGPPAKGQDIVGWDALEAAAAEQAQPNDKPTSKPWYLQEQPPQPEPQINPFAERQKIPELPQIAPPILEPLLNQISIDLGLDYLNLLDLRKVEPPPAFGANLLMIVGTARSEKHLNVSADRLCRWLRTHYKLTPKADGLLGRNEIKLKNKRRARRSRIMNAAGGGQIPDEEGNTGWICVNVGTVEGGLLPGMEDPTSRPGFIGFGSGIKGAKIVVQMMTEEKRADLDLEALWQGMIDRDIRREAGVKRAIEKEEAAAADGVSLDPSPLEDLHQVASSNMATYAPPRRMRPRTTSENRSSLLKRRTPQARGFHSYARQCSPEDAWVLPKNSNLENTGDMEDIVDLQTAANLSKVEDTPNQDPSSYHPSFPSLSQDHPQDISESITDWSLSLSTEINTITPPDRRHKPGLETHALHWKYITETCTPAQAIAALGHHQDDNVSTRFLLSLNLSDPTFRTNHDFRFRILLHTHAISLGHPGYTRARLLDLLREAQSRNVPLNRAIFLRCLRTTLIAHNVIPTHKNETTNPRRESRGILRRVFAYSKEILELMELYDHDLTCKDVYSTLHAAVMNPLFESPNQDFVPPSVQSQYTYHHTADRLQNAYHHARKGDPAQAGYYTSPAEEMSYAVTTAVSVLYKPLPVSTEARAETEGKGETNYDTSLYLELLHSYMTTSNFSAFNHLWRILPKLFIRRDPEMYCLLFEGQAAYGSVQHAAETVREGTLEMAQEEPPVQMRDLDGRVAKAVKACLIKAGVKRMGWGVPFDGVWREVDGVLGREEVEEGAETVEERNRRLRLAKVRRARWQKLRGEGEEGSGQKDEQLGDDWSGGGAVQG